jgi:hypothetical protein
MKSFSFLSFVYWCYLFFLIAEYHILTSAIPQLAEHSNFYQRQLQSEEKQPDDPLMELPQRLVQVNGLKNSEVAVFITSTNKKHGKYILERYISSVMV